MTRNLVGGLATLMVMLFVVPVQAVDTDGDGLLDLIDVPGFDPNREGFAN